eukprot:3447654-Amphidinium_carterae.1
MASKRPCLRIDKTFTFRGQHSSALGTNLLFKMDEEESSWKVDDEQGRHLSDPSFMLHFFGQTVVDVEFELDPA